MYQRQLRQSEIRQYHEEGYLIPQIALEKSEIEELKLAVERVLETNSGIRPEQLVSVHIDRLNDEGVRGDRTFFELANHPVILDCVEKLIGPDIILWGCQLFCKPSADGMEVPMHQDGNYWPIRPLAACTAWVAIDESKIENGCMKVVPGSHKESVSFQHSKDQREKLVLNQMVDDDRVDLGKSLPLELDPGSFSLHDVHLIHGSSPNISGKRRAGVAIRYMPATSHFNRELIETGKDSGYLVNFSERPLWLLRGEDKAGNDLEIGHS